jgi:hypothetical protein
MGEHVLLFCLLGLVLTATIILVVAPGAVLGDVVRVSVIVDHRADCQRWLRSGLARQLSAFFCPKNSSVAVAQGPVPVIGPYT